MLFVDLGNSLGITSSNYVYLACGTQEQCSVGIVALALRKEVIFLAT